MRGRPHLCNVPFDLFLEQFLIKTVQIVHNFGFPPLNRFLLRSFCCDIWPGKWSNQNLEIVRPTILSFFFFLTDLILTCGHLLKFYWDLLIHIFFWTVGLIKLQKICRPIWRVYIIKKTLQDIFSSNLNLPSMLEGTNQFKNTIQGLWIFGRTILS